MSVMREGIKINDDGSINVQATGSANITGGSIMGATLVGASGQILSKSGIPFIKPPSGTMGNNGAFVLGTALPRTIAQGYMWFDANQIASGIAAGWYWFTGTDSTHVTVFNSTYVSGTPVVGTATAFATTGPGAITSSTSEVFGPTITVPANLLGKNGELLLFAIFTSNNTAGAKTVRFRWSGNAGAAFASDGSLASTTGEMLFGEIFNAGATNAQVANAYAIRNTNAIGVAGTTTGAVDTTAATTLVASMQTSGTATDYLILEAFRFVVWTDAT